MKPRRLGWRLDVLKLDSAGSTGLARFGSGLGLRPLSFELLRGGLRRHRCRRRGLAEVAVDQCQGHPGVRGVGAVDGAPRGEGRQGLLEAGPLLAHQQVACWDHQAVGAGAEPPLDELVKSSQVRHHFQTGIRDEKVDTVGAIAATRLCEVPRSGGDDDHAPVSAGYDDPLEVRHPCSRVTSWTTTISPTTWKIPSFSLLIAEI